MEDLLAARTQMAVSLMFHILFAIAGMAMPVLMPFSLEGFAFFTGAIFLGIYLYGWDRVPPRMHLLAGIVVALAAGAVLLFPSFFYLYRVFGKVRS